MTHYSRTGIAIILLSLHENMDTHFRTTKVMPKERFSIR